MASYETSLSLGDNFGLPIMLEPDDDSTQFTISKSQSGTTTPRIDDMKEVHVPTHPIPSMQNAFAESMLEASEGSTPTAPKSRPGNAAARRKSLLDQDVSEETHAARWRQKPGQQYHELWKLMAQISFGIYLLLNGIAKDNEQVLNILQGHVDEVDEFLETTLEDFDLAQEDIDERLKFLKLPLENIVIFDAMLEDRNFRLQIVTGNERIEHVITRTARAMNDALKDVQQGLDACKEFTIYLAEEQEEAVWANERPDMQKVFDAMKGNVDGWYNAYVSLQTKGNNLGVALVQLGSIVAEMDRRAGEVSRQTRFSQTSIATPMASPPSPPRQSRTIRQSMMRTLPSDPSPITPAIQATLPAFQLVKDRDRKPELEPKSSSEAEAEPDFILKPATYSPFPSPNPAPPPTPPVVKREPSPPPEVRQRSSLRERFSLKRKETPSEITLKAPPPQADESYWSPRQQVHSSAGPRERENSLNTPPSRGLDSAYCSDFEKPSPPTATHPALLPTTYSPKLANYPRTNTVPLQNSPPVFARDFMPSPRSESHYFRPVQASPHSPLQRPWTASGAANPLHQHNNSSVSNLSSLRGHTHQPSGLGNRRPGAAPSTMGMSMVSDMTMVTQPDGQRVKKKRSAFGWLKKAFSLSEEEKAAFERRRRMEDAGAKEYYQRGPPRWVDGKRVR